MPRQLRYPYKKQAQFTERTRLLLQAASKARDVEVAVLIREYVTAGLARDIVRYSITLPPEDKDPA